MKKETRNKWLFIALFALIGFGAMQVPFSKLLGVESLRFSLFDFYGPIAGAFVGSIWGLVTVVLMQLANWALGGFSLEVGTLLRFLPVLFAVLYFAKKSSWTLVVPVIAMIVFWINPIGRQAWYFALYWTIPLIVHFWRDKYIFARALGATFTQHSVGGALWVWAITMSPEMWTGLIPIVWKERGLMAIGITITYIAFNYLTSWVVTKTKIKLPFVTLNPKYTTSTR